MEVYERSSQTDEPGIQIQTPSAIIIINQIMLVIYEVRECWTIAQQNEGSHNRTENIMDHTASMRPPENVLGGKFIIFQYVDLPNITLHVNQHGSCSVKWEDA